MAGGEVQKIKKPGAITRPPIIQLDTVGNCVILPTAQVPMLAQLCEWMADRHGGDGRVLAVAWYNKLFAGNATRPTVEELIQVFYRAYVNKLDPMMNQCHARIMNTQKNGRQVVFTTGIDGWLSRAADHDNYLGTQAEAICENDDFEWDAVNEKPRTHRYGKKDRGEVHGGWGRLKRRGFPDLTMTVDRNEFMALLEGQGRDFLHKKMSKHMTRWMIVRHLIRQAYPKVLQDVLLPDEVGAITTDQGVVEMQSEKATGPNKDELPQNDAERTDMLEEIDDLFTALGVTSDNEKERYVMRRKKAELVLRRSLNHISLSDLFDQDLVTLRDKLKAEKEGKAEPKEVEVVEPQEVPAIVPEQQEIVPKAEPMVACEKCGEQKVPSFVAKTQKDKKFPVLCSDCGRPSK